MRGSHLSTLRVLVSVACVALPGLTLAQDGDGRDYPGAGVPFGAVEAGRVGYELALSGATSAERGAALVFSGVAYEVTGAVTLHATPGLDVEASVQALTVDGTAWRTLETRSVRAAEAGHFEVAVRMPEEDLASPRVVFRVHRPGAPGRVFSYDVAALATREIDLLTDRERYEPGETVHVWARISALRTGAPAADRPLTLSLTDATGTELARRELRSRASGAVTLDVPLPATTTPGTCTVTVTSDPTVLAATRRIEVFARTTERLVATITLDDDLVEAGGPLTGVVRVTDASGSPVRGAHVELRVSSDTSVPLELTTGADGTVRFSAAASSYLASDVGYDSAVARVVHGASGTITTVAGYTIARTAWLVSATPEAGGLVPELDTRLYLAVNDPRGTPIAAGVALEVRGLGVSGGHATTSTDVHGLAEVVVHLPRGAAARMDGGACGGVTSTSLEVEVQTTPAVVARVCVPVALHADVLPRVRASVVSPQDSLEVDVFRRTAIAGRPVLLELLSSGDRAVATTWVTGARGTLTVPGDVRGVLTVRARAMAPDDLRAPLDDEGATLVGTGARAALLVRPADAFALTVSAARPVARVRETASVEIHGSTPPAGGGWATLVVRDEAQHGGEGDYAMESVGADLRSAVRGPVAATDERLVRAALAAGVSMEAEGSGAPPLVPEPWEVASGRYGWAAGAAGVLRDPIALREEAVRTSCGAAMTALERLVVSLSGLDADTRARAVRRSGTRTDFGPDALELAGMHGLTTLGGLPLTAAHLTEIDPSFGFDTVARRAARSRLVLLLLSLVRLGSPDDEAALRASAGQSPDRWLGLLVQLGMVRADQLVDPWGRPYELRRATGRSPVVVFSEAAAEWELSSPGPDGLAGNADDVRDPFGRVVPEGTPYAVLSGEDDLMRMLSRIAPGTNVLAAMAGAYARLGLGADEERRTSVVSATTSEAGEMPAPRGEAAAYDIDMLLEGALGGGRSTGGAGPTTASTRAPARDPAEPDVGLDREARAYDFDDDMVSGDLVRPDAELASVATATPPPPPPGTPAFAALAAVIREDFPATLFFAGEVPLDASGNARVDVALADAITTYRLEAIAWTASGWTTSGRGTLRVEQEAEVDAPVPEVAVVGDVFRLPLRVRNRGTAPLRVRLSVRTEGDAGITVGDAPTLEVPAGDAVLATLEVRATRAGLGAIVVEAVRDSDGAALDAVRRPVEIVNDARVVRETLERLVSSGDEVRLDLPADATARGDGEVRLRVAAEVFGDPSDWWADDPASAGFALALAGGALPAGLAESLHSFVMRDDRYGDGRTYLWRDPVTMASVLGALWASALMTDAEASVTIRFLSGLAGASAPIASGYDPYAPVTLPDASSVLLALAPAVRSDARPALRADLEALVALLADHAGSEGAVAAEDPTIWARVAAALALTSASQADDARADEMLRRLERHVVTAGSFAWLEPSYSAWLESGADDGSVDARITPTALLALARAARGNRASALALVGAMADVARGAARWPTRARALACAAAAMLIDDAVDADSAALVVDGRAVPFTDDESARIAIVPGLGGPGAHMLTVTLPDGAVALLDAEVRYSVPWATPPRTVASVDIRWSGEVGPRDARSGLSLHLYNRGARVLVRPVVEIQLPAGAELDEASREGLATITGAAASVEGNVLRLELRPLAPGGTVRIPLRARWSLGGSFRGLGVSVVDEATRARAAAVLPSRAVDIADEGPEPSSEDAEVPDAPRGVRPPPFRPLAEALR